MTEKDLKKLRKQVACFMRRLYERGLTTASGGNISVRLNEGIFITPSGMDKAMIKGRQVGTVSFKGKNLTPELIPSMESAMHIAIYKTRPDVNAIVHAHPPVATSFTALKKGIDCSLIAEARAILGVPVSAPYALMGTSELATSVAEAAGSTQVNNDETAVYPNVILLQNHGIVCLGKDLLTAFDRMEVLESAAKMTVVTAMLGGRKALNSGQLKEIDRFMKNS